MMGYDLRTLKGDVVGGCMSALVALPWSIAFGAAAGLSLTAGLYGAIAVALFVGVFERTRVQVGDVSSATAIPVAAVVATYSDSAAKALTIVMLAGAIQAVLGLLRLARFVAYTPYSVIAGFMTGIGMILVLSMVTSFLGAPVKVFQVVTAVRQWPDAFADIDYSALALGLMALAAALLWPKRWRVAAPPMLIALVVSTLASVVWFRDVATIGNIPTGLPDLHAPVLSGGFLVEALTPALGIALLSTVRGLLSLFALDAQTSTQLDPDRSLLRLGAGNIAAGVIGGLPGHHAILPTMVAIRAGARTHVAVIMRSLALLAVVLGLGRALTFVPHVALAAVLAIVGWQLIDWRILARVHRVQREHLLIMLTTLGIMLFVDLVTAVAVGMIVAAMVSARQFERLQLDSVVSIPLLDQAFLYQQDSETHGISPYSARTGLVILRGSFTVASASQLIRTIGKNIVGHKVVILDFSETDYIDDSAALVIEQLIDTVGSGDATCIILGLHGAPAAAVESLNVLRRVPAEHVVATLDQARELCLHLLDDSPDPPGANNVTE